MKIVLSTKVESLEDFIKHIKMTGVSVICNDWENLTVIYGIVMDSIFYEKEEHKL